MPVHLVLAFVAAFVCHANDSRFELLNSMRTNPVGKPKDAHVQVYPTTNLVYTPPHCDMVCLRDLDAGAASHHSFFPFSLHFANPRWWQDLGIAPSRPTIPQQVHIPDITHPTFDSTSSLQWYRGASCAPPFISSEPPFRTQHFPDPPHGVMGNPDPAPDRVGPSRPPLNFVDGNGYIVLRGLVEPRDCEVGWNKVMKAWGSGDEKVVAKTFELLFNAGRSEDEARDPDPGVATPRFWTPTTPPTNCWPEARGGGGGGGGGGHGRGGVVKEGRMGGGGSGRGEWGGVQVGRIGVGGGSRWGDLGCVGGLQPASMAMPAMLIGLNKVSQISFMAAFATSLLSILDPNTHSEPSVG